MSNGTLSVSKTSVLKVLAKDGQMTSAQIREETSLTEKNVANALQHLVRFRYVTRNRDVQRDARAWLYRAVMLPVKLHKQIIEEREPLP